MTITIIAVLLLICCIAQTIFGKNSFLWALAAWLIGVFLFGMYFDAITGFFYLTGSVARFIFGAVVLGIVILCIRKCGKKL